MNSIYSLFTSIANLARSLNRLAATVDAVAGEAERRVELIDHRPAARVPVIESTGHANGELAKAGRARKYPQADSAARSRPPSLPVAIRRTHMTHPIPNMPDAKDLEAIQDLA